MTITFYVDWEAGRVYKNESELIEGYLDYQGGKDMSFNEYLGEMYEPDTLFNATEEKKKKILEQYNADMLEGAKDWARNCDMINTIEI